MTFSEPSLPPLLNGRVVIKGDDPLELAIAGAKAGELGAGDALWLQDTTEVSLAIVLEPDDPLVTSAQMLPLAVAAAGDCLAGLVPPQVGVQFRWPATLLLNGADVGNCSLTVNDTTASSIPQWMVLGFNLRLAFDESVEPGTTPGVTSLSEEGIEEATTVDIIEALSRHFLAKLDTWSHEGFREVSDNWSARMEGLAEADEINHPGSAVITARPLSLDEDGNLLIRETGDGPAKALKLIDCIRHAPS